MIEMVLFRYTARQPVPCVYLPFHSSGCQSFRRRPEKKGPLKWSAAVHRSVDAIVVVESPSKATKIQKFLGEGYQVLASFGHVRDIEPKEKGVDANKSFEIRWEVSEKGKMQLDVISKALESASRLILATDPDREGEAISWHVARMLEEQRDCHHKQIQRISFNEISRQAILYAMDHPREIDANLVNAYMARKVIDHLMGFNISPVLWRKVPGAKSAGRVQSPCLRLICDREDEISQFRKRKYWSVEAQLKAARGSSCAASLTCLNGKTLNQLDLSTEKKAQDALTKVMEATLYVKEIKDTFPKERPFAPYRTSTLQQDAASRLGWKNHMTMKTAQSLYEGDNTSGDGLITYIRTDGVSISPASIERIRKLIKDQYGGDSLPLKARRYSTKVKNAQEAHEAIHPTNVSMTVKQLPASLTTNEKKLYKLIWERTVASQMSDAKYSQRSVVVSDEQGALQLRTTAKKMEFRGFKAVYNTTMLDAKDSDEKPSTAMYKALSTWNDGQQVTVTDAQKTEHETKPPPRFNDASIVKTMEELGIGRPSTFAMITNVLISRQYARREGRSYIPEPLGRVVSVYLSHQFKDFTDYEFTSKMENRLDDVASGKENWKAVAEDFWNVLYKTIGEAKNIRQKIVIDYVNEQILESIFIPLVTEEKPLKTLRKCPTCSKGELLIKFGRFGPFLGCDQYHSTKCSHSQSIASVGQDPTNNNTTEKAKASTKTKTAFRKKKAASSKSAKTPSRRSS